MTSFTINNYKVPLFTINKYKARLLWLLTWQISLQKNKNTTKKIVTPVLNDINSGYNTLDCSQPLYFLNLKGLHVTLFPIFS